MSVTERIEEVYSRSGLTPCSLIRSPKSLHKYFGLRGTFDHGLAHETKFSKEQKRLNKNLEKTKTKKPDFF